MNTILILKFTFPFFLWRLKEMGLELEAKQEAMQSLQETAHHLCQENHPAKQTVEVRFCFGHSGISLLRKPK